MATRSRPTDDAPRAEGGDDGSPHGSSDGSADGGRQSNREKKLERKALEVLAQRLASLRPYELDHLKLDEDLREAIDEFGSLSGSARNRQAKVVHGLLRDADLENLQWRLERGGASSYAPVPAEEKGPLDVWLGRLLEEGDAAVNELVDAYPAADRQQLRQLIRTSSKTPPSTASRRALRSLRTTLEGLLG